MDRTADLPNVRFDGVEVDLDPGRTHGERVTVPTGVRRLRGSSASREMRAVRPYGGPVDRPSVGSGGSPSASRSFVYRGGSVDGDQEDNREPVGPVHVIRPRREWIRHREMVSPGTGSDLQTSSPISALCRDPSPGRVRPKKRPLARAAASRVPSLPTSAEPTLLSSVVPPCRSPRLFRTTVHDAPTPTASVVPPCTPVVLLRTTDLDRRSTVFPPPRRCDTVIK